jgi:hypothetical protein
MPRFEIENVPPMYSCGFSFFSRARAARSFISAAICASPFALRVAHHRRDQPTRNGHCYRDMRRLVLRHALVGVAGVGIRIGHQRHRARLDQHVVDRHLHAGLLARLVDAHARRQQMIDLQIDVSGKCGTCMNDCVSRRAVTFRTPSSGISSYVSGA